MASYRLHQLVFSALLTVAYSVAASVVVAQPPAEDTVLTERIAALDSKVFDAYNHCDLVTFASYFVPRVEFFHDTGGATFDRKTVVGNTRKYICNKVRRELISESFRVYPIKQYGAIEEGEHRFCELATGKCEGIAKFLMIWRNKNGRWQLTKVVSYGHRALNEAEKKTLADQTGTR